VKATTAGRNAALIFLLGVLAIVVFGLFNGLRPDIDGAPMGMTPIIEMIMFVTGTVILLVCKPAVAKIPEQSVFRAGMVSALIRHPGRVG
jgi:anaerobic C4-dicarboxylate transporter DcuA/anaerobic C4-dicarboxylate transporter DcuB